ncbi:ACP S-malonyltransferase [Caldichromatium japonicum]|uniref:Malonyl CoA-acyl carrier protein transacylase n=1 Tax=Caldichromatium japonicum TaxID=2699430 RepID=A0A6G7VDM8_9GAMM|nr:ACP S-malonyltransferase [Caldichromatium japonicum]QIK38074.1 ACP S-malonyltransferase [Caldichromatium japonicum]
MTQRLAVFFPGQGSQSVGMLDALAQSYPIVRATFEEASDAIGRDLWRLASQGPKEDLDLTENTQPVMLAADIAVWRVWQQAGGPMAELMAGHSLGEYAALVAAGALGFADGVRLANQRARLMQAAVPEGSGAMAAILGLAEDQVIALCAEQAQGAVLAAVNFNAPGQIVIAGEAAAVARAIEAAKGAGTKRSVLLPVSVPSHCALMRPAAEGLAEYLANIPLTLPSVPVIHNVNVAPPPDIETLRRLLVEQLYSPVRWVETVQVIAAQGIAVALECGPGKVLTGLNKRIVADLKTLPVFDPVSLETALEATSHACG